MGIDGIRGKDAVGQTHNGVQVELGQQFLLDPGAHAIAEQRAVGHDHAGPAAFLRSRPWAFQLPHDELQEQQGRFRGLLVGREVAPNPRLFLPAERRVGQDHVHSVPVADLGELDAPDCCRRRSVAISARATAGSSGRACTGAASPRRRRCSVPARPSGVRPSCTAFPDGCTTRPGSRPCRRPGQGSSRPVADRCASTMNRTTGRGV